MSIPVAIWAKAPIPGHVKTRLAGTLGSQQAADLAVAFLQDVYTAIEKIPAVHPVLATNEAGALEAFGLPECTPIWLQGLGDLGARLERISRAALAQHEAVLHIGADSPAFPTEALVDAARALVDGRDAVLGRADDGGFWLLGLRRCPADLFTGILWSTSRTAQLTHQRLTSQGLEVFEVASWFDVDGPDGLQELRRHLADQPESAPHTADALRRLTASQ